METKFVLINKNCRLVGGARYSKEELAKAIENSNIPQDQIEAHEFSFNFLNDCYIHPENYSGGKK